MILASHVIFGTYGFWLPNDPRGSWSTYVRCWEIFLEGGTATKVATTDSHAHIAHDVKQRLDTKKSLMYPPVILNGLQARAVGHGFAKVVSEYKHPVFACSILPEHVHLVIGRTTIDVRQVVKLLKQQATLRLKEEGLHPFAEMDASISPWSRGCWSVFLNDEEAVHRAIRYVENNPLKEGKPKQNWSFVKPFQ